MREKQLATRCKQARPQPKRWHTSNEMISVECAIYIVHSVIGRQRTDFEEETRQNSSVKSYSLFGERVKLATTGLST